ncbi:MAG: hypothetical protein CMP60_01115 [Flavobacteriales bacterium]|nr:hypothetical protein [Flavobacteriales bacterium]|tara:strand:+ start:166 stop:762 length:597 start_codon:yes stop_codon:yes gene_type:complete
MNSIINYFLRGILYIVPLSATIYILYISILFIENMIEPILESINTIINVKTEWISLLLGVIIIFILVLIIGFLGSLIISTPINSFFKKLLKQAPLIQTIYTSIKDLMNTFVGNKKGFSEPVLVKLYENSTIERIGFVTNEDISSVNIKKGKVLVYLPHSYAISGQLFVVEKKDVTPIDKSSGEIMKLIISGGVTEVHH